MLSSKSLIQISLLLALSTQLSCKVKKQVSISEVKEKSKVSESTNWIRSENIFSKVDGTSQIKFEGLSEVVIGYDGSISMKGSNATILNNNTRVDSIFKTDTIFVDRVTEIVKESKTKDIQKERSNIPFWIYLILIGVVIGILIYRFR